MMKIKELKESLTPQDIIDILESLGVDRYSAKEEYVIFPTICHNIDSKEASMKLYYYKDTKLFHCYTGCSESFDIYTLLKKWYAIRGIEEYSFEEDIYNKIKNRVNFVDTSETAYTSMADKYHRVKISNTQKPFPREVLEVFDKRYPQEWLAEGISQKAMDQFNILFSQSRNQIIIPHYNIDGKLIGIRGRLLNEDEAATYGKYMPVKIEDTVYKHRLMFNLYGLHLNKESIRRRGIVVIFESEKSVLKYSSFFDENISVAVCGSSIFKPQTDILVSLGVKEAVICFDKEYVTLGTEKAEKYFDKLYKMAEKYNEYMNFSFVFDREDMLKEKDSPIDRGPEVFTELLKKRIFVRS